MAAWKADLPARAGGAWSAAAEGGAAEAAAAAGAEFAGAELGAVAGHVATAIAGVGSRCACGSVGFGGGSECAEGSELPPAFETAHFDEPKGFALRSAAPVVAVARWLSDVFGETFWGIGSGRRMLLREMPRSVGGASRMDPSLPISVTME